MVLVITKTIELFSNKASFTLLIAASSVMLFAPYTSSAFYQINSSGAQCDEIGEWDGDSLTCTLNQDIEDYILIQDPLITIDGNGHSIDLTESSDSYGVYVNSVLGVIVEKQPVVC